MTIRALIPQSNELIAFEAAARHCSFTRAADELNLTQGAISKAVCALELRLGARLFERVRQRVLLTAAGEEYLRDVGPILQEIEDATLRIQSAGEAQRLTVAVLPTMGIRWLIPRLPRFLAAHPDTVFTFVTRIRPFALDEERCDVALHHGRSPWPGAVTRPLMAETMLPMASTAYRLAHGITGPETLARGTLLHQSTRPSAWTQWHERHGLSAAAAHCGPSFDQFGMVAQAAAAGIGAALLPKFLVEQEVQDGKLEVLFNLPLRTGSAYHLVLSERGAKEIARAFAVWLEQEFRPGDPVQRAPVPESHRNRLG